LPERPKSRTSAGATQRRPQPETSGETIYAEIALLIQKCGWARGRRRHRGALSLLAAIDVAAGVGDQTRPESEGTKLARAARVAAHLRDLAGTRNLDAWEDDRERQLTDVFELLAHAGQLFDSD
jgi:hypothetical protein